MPTRLSAPSVSRAIDHLCKYGDTDVLPHLPELVFLHENRSEIIKELSTLDLDSTNPSQAIETISPKSRFGFRIVHQMLSLETVLFLASMIEIAGDLENLKKDKDELSGSFAYRFDTNSTASLFIAGRTYRDWLNWQRDKIDSDLYSHVISTDIADFYQRIYLHRIENCLDVATSKKGIKRYVERVIKNIRSKQSHGIPVGGTASRLIAEAVLSDSDNALANEDIAFTRFVDDFRIFVKKDQSPDSRVPCRPAGYQRGVVTERPEDQSIHYRGLRTINI